MAVCGFKTIILKYVDFFFLHICFLVWHKIKLMGKKTTNQRPEKGFSAVNHSNVHGVHSLPFALCYDTDGSPQQRMLRLVSIPPMTADQQFSWNCCF